MGTLFDLNAFSTFLLKVTKSSVFPKSWWNKTDSDFLVPRLFWFMALSNLPNSVIYQLLGIAQQLLHGLLFTLLFESAKLLPLLSITRMSICFFQLLTCLIVVSIFRLSSSNKDCNIGGIFLVSSSPAVSHDSAVCLSSDLPFQLMLSLSKDLIFPAQN